MIVGERKPFEEIQGLLGGYNNILLVGCGTCVKVCFTGGDKEVAVLASQLRLAAAKGKKKRAIDEMTVERQCETEFVDEVAKQFKGHDVIMSMACGAGVQMLAERFPDVPVLPAVNTTFLGLLQKQGHFVENCQGCGTCVLGTFGGICPVTPLRQEPLQRPLRRLPGREVRGRRGRPLRLAPDHRAADQAQAAGQPQGARSPRRTGSTARHGGPRKLIREDNIL